MPLTKKVKEHLPLSVEMPYQCYKIITVPGTVASEASLLRTNISFSYCEYNMNKELIRKERAYPYLVSPYGVICSYGRYFLVGYHIPSNSKRIYRIDKIMDVEEDGTQSYHTDTDLDLGKYMENSVFMHISDSKITVRFRCRNDILDDVIERFENCRLLPDERDANHFLATIPDTTHMGMKLWALEFSSSCEVLSPESLREDVYKTLAAACSRYDMTPPALP
jgi:predicted DNA-binding transcriptional regulator YafY